MALGTAALRTMGECASHGISPYAWGPALVGAADRIDALERMLRRVADRLDSSTDDLAQVGAGTPRLAEGNRALLAEAEALLSGARP